MHPLALECRMDMAEDIVEFLKQKRVDLRKLILRFWCYERGAGFLANIVALYPDLEALSLDGFSVSPSAGYCVISHLKKLSALNLLNCHVC
jgi:hypothetical protein